VKEKEEKKKEEKEKKKARTEALVGVKRLNKAQII
jgi:hypothetical protein